MTNLARGLDHVIIAVPDLGRARSACERLGFVVTDRASHPRFGTANHLLVFENAYLELLAIVDANPTDASFQRVLKTRDFGVHTFALATNDIDAEYRRLSALEPSLSTPVAWTRTATDAEPDKIAAFSTMMLPETLTPAIPMFYCQQKTREMVWRSRSVAHPNGARRLSRVAASAGAVGATAAGKYRSLFPGTPVTAREGSLEIRFDDHSLELQERTALQKRPATIVLKGQGLGQGSGERAGLARELPECGGVMFVLEE